MEKYWNTEIVNKQMQVNLCCHWNSSNTINCFIVLILTLLINLVLTFFMGPSYELNPWVQIDFILTNTVL